MTNLIGAIFDSMKLSYALNDGYHTPEEVRGFLSGITGQEIDETVTLLPPFYVDYGKNIRFGKRCWIQQGCTFCDRGGYHNRKRCVHRAKSEPHYHQPRSRS